MNQPCSHLHGPAAVRDMSQALAEAKRRCAAAGETWTAPRHRTYELLLQAAGPVKAYDLMRRYQPGGGAKPPTVYRSLDFLMGLGLVHKIETLSAYVACEHGQGAHAAAFLICACCGRTRELDPADAQPQRLVGDGHGYAIESVRLEISGRCPDCR